MLLRSISRIIIIEIDAIILPSSCDRLRRASTYDRRRRRIVVVVRRGGILRIIVVVADVVLRQRTRHVEISRSARERHRVVDIVVIRGGGEWGGVVRAVRHSPTERAGQRPGRDIGR